MPDAKRCPVCEGALTPETASTTTVRRGGYCRVCARDYKRTHQTRSCVICGSACDSHVMRCLRCKASDLRRVRPERPTRLRMRNGRPTGKAWDILRQGVIAEETHCGFCGEPVDKQAKGSQGPAVDHIIPLALGGHPTDRANLRLAHHGCNSSHGMKTLIAQADLARIRALALHLVDLGL